jgi:hypothetical protein
MITMRMNAKTNGRWEVLLFERDNNDELGRKLEKEEKELELNNK